jgi:hypothetical protein
MRDSVNSLYRQEFVKTDAGPLWVKSCAKLSVVRLCSRSQEDRMWVKLAMARPVIPMLLLALVVAASSCERERQPEKPSKDRPPNLS